jgi:hypothetical protein
MRGRSSSSSSTPTLDLSTLSWRRSTSCRCQSCREPSLRAPAGHDRLRPARPLTFAPFSHPTLPTSRVCAQADKWQAPGVAHAALERAHRFPSHVPGLFALAVLHDSAVVAADMLGLFDGGAPVFRFAKVERDAPYVYTRPAWRLADIPASLGIQMMERQAALSWTLLQIESAIFDPECSQVKSWPPLACDLKAVRPLVPLPRNLGDVI